MRTYDFVLLLVFTLFRWVSGSNPARIVGGQEATAGMFPYAAAIHVTTPTSKFFCGGALLGNEWVVTAAQCVDKATSFTIQLGSNSLTAPDSNRVTLASSTFVIHPDYNPETLDSDLGLIKLRMPVEFTDYIKGIQLLPVANTPQGWRVLTPGWGQTSDSDPALAENLNWVALDTLTNEECRITFGDQITENMLCAAGNYDEGTCVGDTGSPLIYLLKFGNPQLLGVSSFVSGSGCQSLHPSGYTRVFPFAHWIANITGLN